ncbi:transposase InsO family protein [Roseomonas pecuniae]|uniref:Transposase InsO family protein n=1 Tax=Muricoccus pecuniae TaxID=693023 RepID=A0A840Y1P4_9PROT|nr:transposase InsO family protein [Roseomonas pecuniae]
MRFRFVEDHRTVFAVRVMCSVLEVSASGYYAWRRRPESVRSAANRLLLEDIRRVHADSRRRYGSPRVHAALQAEGQRVGRNRVARLMRRHGIRVRTKRRFRVTTDSSHAFPLAPNLLDRQFTASGPNKVWLADITYIPTGKGWLYLAVVLDLLSRKVVGWAMRDTLAQELTLAALRMAITNRKPGPGLLHHADRGSQYAAHDYRRLLARRGMLCSMSRKGDCWDCEYTGVAWRA